MEVRLLVKNAKASAKQVRLGPKTVIGRGTECNLRIASAQVSRKHCVITVADSRVHVRDLGSANGTFVNGEQLPKDGETVLIPGSHLEVGPLSFVINYSPPPPPPRAPLPPAVDEAEARRKAAEAAAEIQALVPTPGDGEETKDYFPAKSRAPSASSPPPPVSVEETAGPALEETDFHPAPQPATSEAAPPVEPGETTVDPRLAGRVKAEGESVLSDPLGGGTDLYFEEDDAIPLFPEADIPEALPAHDEDPDAPGPAAEEPVAEEPAASPPAEKPKSKGWGIMKFLRRDKKRSKDSAPAPAPSTATSAKESSSPEEDEDAETVMMSPADDPDSTAPLSDDDQAAAWLTEDSPPVRKPSKSGPSEDDDAFNNFLKNT